jgi:hypothetical protein
MIENLSLAIRKLSAGIILTLMAGAPLQAQGTGTPQSCTDPGSNTGDTGCVSFMYQGQQVTYTTVRAKDGNIWLQQNLEAYMWQLEWMMKTLMEIFSNGEDGMTDIN